jgi:hypothetical protein
MMPDYYCEEDPTQGFDDPFECVTALNSPTSTCYAGAGPLAKCVAVENLYRTCLYIGAAFYVLYAIILFFVRREHVGGVPGFNGSLRTMAGCWSVLAWAVDLAAMFFLLIAGLSLDTYKADWGLALFIAGGLSAIHLIASFVVPYVLKNRNAGDSGRGIELHSSGSTEAY